jgi:hypothetical protein
LGVGYNTGTNVSEIISLAPGVAWRKLALFSGGLDINSSNGSTAASFDTSGNQTLSSGNLVIGTNGKGIDFSATPGTGTSELLSDYEEGTFTSTISAYAGTFTTVAATMKYVKVGKQVTVSFTVSITSNGTASGNIQLTVPFTSDSGVGYCGSAREGASTGTMSSVSMVPSDNKLAIQTYNNLYPGGDGYNIDGSLTYFVA